jgi:hypothetical protein
VGEDLHHAFDVILTPQAGAVPEPSTFWLSITALTAIHFLVQRKKGRSHDEKTP